MQRLENAGTTVKIRLISWEKHKFDDVNNYKRAVTLMTVLFFLITLSLDRFKSIIVNSAFSCGEWCQNFYFLSVSRHQPCLYLRTVTHRHSFFLHSPTPCFCRSSSLTVFFRSPRQGNSLEGTGIRLQHVSNPCLPILLLLIGSLIVFVLALLCTS